MTLAMPRHLTTTELELALGAIGDSPKDFGPLEMIVRRPAVGAREVVQSGELHPLVGLVGDSWSRRGSRRSADGGPHPEMQLNIMNARVAGLVAQAKDRWALAGDQLFVDMDLSADNLPAGARLQLGGAVIEITAEPHTGCGKFIERFGVDAAKFVNASERRDLRLRGLNAKVVQGGEIRVGDRLTKL